MDKGVGMLFRISVFVYFLITLYCCSGFASEGVVLSEVSYFMGNRHSVGKKGGTLLRGQRFQFLGNKKTITVNGVQRQLVFCDIRGFTSPVWIPYKEYFSNGLGEQRLWIGYNTNAYLVKKSYPSLFPGSSPLRNISADIGTGLVVLGKKAGWLKVHFQDKFLWFPNQGFTYDRFYPEISIRDPKNGEVRITSSPWLIRYLGDERQYSPDRLLSNHSSYAWISHNSGIGSTIVIRFKHKLRFTMGIINGFAFSPHSYSLYNRLKQCRITCGSREAEVVLQDGCLTSQSLGGWHGKKIVFNVKSVYSGTGRDHLVLQKLRITPVGLR